MAETTNPPLAFQVPEMRRIRHIHFVGIGGAGMSGIAEVLKNQGYDVSGSDLKEGVVTNRLKPWILKFTLAIGQRIAPKLMWLLCLPLLHRITRKWYPPVADGCPLCPEQKCWPKLCVIATALLLLEPTVRQRPPV